MQSNSVWIDYTNANIALRQRPSVRSSAIKSPPGNRAISGSLGHSDKTIKRLQSSEEQCEKLERNTLEEMNYFRFNSVLSVKCIT